MITAVIERVDSKLMHNPFASYAGRTAVLATKHGKVDQIGPAMRGALEMEVVGVAVDTDRFGTFSGEVARELSDLDCAVAKARLAMTESQAELGMASEGTIGAHPAVPLLSVDQELVVLVDDRIGHVFSGRAASMEIVAISETVDTRSDFGALAVRADLPRHAVMVRPSVPPRDPVANVEHRVFKGVCQVPDLIEAVTASCAASSLGQAEVTTDLRAHVCPSRQVVITEAASRLAVRLASRCRACRMPGWGLVDVVRGVPCGWCGRSVPLVRTEIDGCWHCGVRLERPVSAVPADPGMCQWCNP